MPTSVSQASQNQCQSGVTVGDFFQTPRRCRISSRILLDDNLLRSAMFLYVLWSEELAACVLDYLVKDVCMANRFGR